MFSQDLQEEGLRLQTRSNFNVSEEILKFGVFLWFCSQQNLVGPVGPAYCAQESRVELSTFSFTRSETLTPTSLTNLFCF